MIARTLTPRRDRARARPVTTIAFALLAWLVLLPAGAAVATAPEPIDTPPPSTFNVFYPEERPLSDCLSAVPKPGCGSEARGGWRQGAIFTLIIAAFGFIAWRVVRAARRRPVPHAPAAADRE